MAVRDMLVASVCGCVAAAAVPSPSQAALIISNAPTQNVACSAGSCAPTAVNAVLNVVELESYLAAGDVSVTSAGAQGIESADVDFHAQMSWRAPTTLSLSAQHSVVVQRKVTVAGQGNLDIVFGSQKIDGRLAFGPNGRISFIKQTSKLRINGLRYDLVASIKDFARKAQQREHRIVALMDNYDASSNGTYRISPIPGGLNIVEGLGNSIDNVTILGGGGRDNNSVGLFSYVHAVYNLRVHHIDIRITNRSADYVGGLAGTAGVMSGDEVTGSVRGTAYIAGGLVGVMDGNPKFRIVASSAHVRVEGFVAGGLVGSVYQDSISSSSASGNVISSGAVAGGLVGYLNQGSLDQSFATGDVVSRTGGKAMAGGLVGLASGSARQSIENSYAFGTVTASSGRIGGLVGEMEGSGLNSSYAIGLVAKSSDRPGGAIGKSKQAQNSNVYWNTTTSADPRGVGTGSQQAVTGLTSGQLMSALPAGFDPAVWAQTPMINSGYPYLINNPPH